MKKVEKKFMKLAGESWQASTPGFAVQAFVGGKKKLDLAVGKTYPHYDLASLTKIVFSASQLMNLADNKQLPLNRQVSDELEWFRSAAPIERQKIRNLLSHSAGLTWWLPIYQSIDTSLSRDEKWEQLETIIAAEMKKSARKKSSYDGKAVYSDLDYFSLGAIIRRKTETSFDKLWEPLADRFDLTETRFHIDNKPYHSRKLYAPTENCNWRGKQMQGEVHDENTWALGGVSTHAGLFGTIDDLSRWGLLLRKGMRGEQRGLATPETVKRFTKRAIPRATGDWALGFMMPSKVGASAGKYFSPQSVGHTGFTGTSLWYDPKKDLLVTILSNRVAFGREDKSFPQVVRPSLHNWIVESLDF